MVHGILEPMRGESVVVQQITSLLGAEVDERGNSGVVVGDSGRGGPKRVEAAQASSLDRPCGVRISAISMLAMWPGYRALDETVAAIESGATDIGRPAARCFNIDFVIVAHGPGATRWLSQRDLALIRSENDYLVLETRRRFPERVCSTTSRPA